MSTVRPWLAICCRLVPAGAFAFTPALALAAETAAETAAAPPPAAPATWRYVGGFTYETRVRGDEGTFVGMAMGGGVRWRQGPNDLSARLALHLGFVPYAIERDGVKLAPNSLSWGLVLGATHLVRSDVWVGVELEPSLELVSHRLPFNSRWREIPRDSLQFAPALTGGLGIGYDFRGMRMGLFVTASVPLADPDYVVLDQTSGERHTLLSPWRVQPGVSLRTFF